MSGPNLLKTFLQTKDLAKNWIEWVFCIFIVLFFSLSAVTPGGVTRFFHLLVAVSLFFPLIQHADLPKGKIKLITLGFLLYILSAVLSLVNSSNWHTGDWGFGRYYRFLFIVPVIIFTIKARLSAYRALLVGVLIGSAIMAFFSFYQMDILKALRVGLGKSLNPNRYGEIGFVESIIIAVALFRFPVKTYFRVILLSCFVLSIFAGLSSGSRGAFLAFIATCGFLTWQLTDRLSRKKRTILLCLVGLISIGFLSALLSLSPFWRQHLSRLLVEPKEYLAHNYYIEHSSTHVRMALAQGGLLIWKKHPFIGTGLGDVAHDMKELVREGQLPVNLTWGRLHNSYIDVLARSGLIGFLCFLVGVLLLPFRVFYQTYNEFPHYPEKSCSSLSGMAVIIFFAVDAGASSCFFNKGVLVFLISLALLLGISLRPESGLVVPKTEEKSG